MKPNAASLILALFLCAQPAWAQPTPEDALKELTAGNARYVSGNSAHPRFEPETRRKLADNGQNPIAAVLGCADARVPPEAIFDQGFGQLFVVRVAGNVCGIPELASIEYAVVAFKTPLIVVLGHTKCGAVEAAVEKKQLPGSLPELMSMIRPALDKASKEQNSTEDLLTRTTRENVYHSMDTLLNLSSIIKAEVEAKRLKVVGGIRDIRDGHIAFLPDQH